MCLSVKVVLQCLCTEIHVQQKIVRRYQFQGIWQLALTLKFSAEDNHTITMRKIIIRCPYPSISHEAPKQQGSSKSRLGGFIPTFHRSNVCSLCNWSLIIIGSWLPIRWSNTYLCLKYIVLVYSLWIISLAFEMRTIFCLVRIHLDIPHPITIC